ncbi:hypothetical protein [Parvularcula sp. IMCC14364]|uniref:hypothetical protein n=1 Tax=Parvularcula sp. IMCC14364 TaxID=3067902 RepID=UPI0027423504|nr:hypothetical protein [Parvularcula sp. IMCC14364]
MIEGLLRNDFRSWLIAMASIAVVLAPMAVEANHVEEQSQSHCEFCVDHTEHEDENHHKGHHAHGCGSCHSHYLAAKTFYASSNCNQSATHYGNVIEAISSTDFSGPFKPPRL